MRKRPLIEVLLTGVVLFALSACGATPATQTAPTLTSRPTTASVTPARCTVESSLVPTPGPTEVALYPAPSQGEWSLGPAGAPVTIIEYGDYQ